jgi:hypothetical protein
MAARGGGEEEGAREEGCGGLSVPLISCGWHLEAIAELGCGHTRPEVGRSLRKHVHSDTGAI